MTKLKPGSVTASVRKAIEQRRAADLIAAAKRPRTQRWQPPAAAVADMDEIIRHNAACPQNERVSGPRIREWLLADHGTAVCSETLRLYVVDRAKVLGV